MTITIDRKIVAYKLADKDAGNQTATSESTSSDARKGNEESRGTASVIQMHETLQRPEVLIGSTYKIKVPEHVSAHAMYITINDIILNEGTEHESRRPFEVFINTKNLDHFQWIVALTVIMSAVFRKGGDITFLVDELRSVFDPRGGYWVKGAYKQSIIAEIGDVIERHLIKIGMLQPRELDESQKELIRQKREALEKREAQKNAGSSNEEAASAKGLDSANPGSSSTAGTAVVTETAGSNVTATAATTATNTGESAAAAASEDSGFPADAQLCSKCNHKAAILMDGCLTCLNCGDSKCG